MSINWKIRLRNKTFWLAFVPAVLLLAQQVAALFGVAVDVSGLQGQLTAIVGTVFAILALLGVVADPTTEGVSDSDRALAYERPNGGE